MMPPMVSHPTFVIVIALLYLFLSWVPALWASDQAELRAEWDHWPTFIMLIWLVTELTAAAIVMGGS